MNLSKCFRLQNTHFLLTLVLRFKCAFVFSALSLAPAFFLKGTVGCFSMPCSFAKEFPLQDTKVPWEELVNPQKRLEPQDHLLNISFNRPFSSKSKTCLNLLFLASMIGFKRVVVCKRSTVLASTWTSALVDWAARETRVTSR